MTNLEKINEMMKNDPALQEKLAAETKRLTDSGEKDLRKITAEAIKSTFGADLTDEELDQVTNAATNASAKASAKLDLDELDNVAGGAEKMSLGDHILAGATLGTVSGAGVGAAVGTCVPVIGNIIGGTAGAAIGAVFGVATGAVAYFVQED